MQPTATGPRPVGFPATHCTALRAARACGLPPHRRELLPLAVRPRPGAAGPGLKKSVGEAGRDIERRGDVALGGDAGEVGGHGASEAFAVVAR